MKKKFIAALILAVILIVSAIVFINMRNNGEEIKEIIISGENYDNCIIEKYENGFVTYNGTELICYDLNMEQQWVASVEESEAKLCVNGSYVLIYSVSGDKLSLVKEGKVLYNIRTDKGLLNAHLNKNGYAVILTADKGYKGQCSVINDRGENVVQYSYGKKYITAAYLASDNRTLVMNIINDGENFSGSLDFIDINKNEVIKEMAFDGIYPYVYMYNDKVFLSNEEKMVCYDKKGKEKWSYDYGNEKALRVKYSDKYMTLVLDPQDLATGNKILTLNYSGRVKGDYISGSVKNFDVSEGYTAVHTEDEILLLNRKGHIKGKAEAEIKTNNLFLLDGGKRLLTVSDKAVVRSFSN